jgi:spore maturation protein CgeB
MWGFKQAGVEMVTAGPYTGQYIPWGGNGLYLDCRAWEPTVELSPNESHTISEVLEKTGPVDFIVQSDAHFALFGDSPVPNVCYAVDNHVRPYNLREYDLVFGAHKWGAMSNKSNFVWLPCAYSPQWHYNAVPWRDREIDACMIGSLYQNRVSAVNSLLFSGFSVTIGVGKVYEKVNKLYNGAKVALCASIKGDVACRVFEGMAQGCVVVSDRLHDADALGLRDGVEYLVYTDEKGLCDHVRNVCNNPDFGESIVTNSLEWVREHTWQARANTILRYLIGSEQVKR